MNQMKKLQENREMLYHLISNSPLKNEEVYKQSCVLDELIVQYMKKQISAQKI
ncbi:aspartyl-phosphate phosphatase Spo0E family protein [Irregularibacter muris]|uniref:Aspartyl-phosphate phosphatase Spo0E family protein n=1 Tax=Irregularibacter muris TaxID=1796619 RepID=A0AAE3L2Y9_9FIRM|nr:aspartyl-phosphate phosphatase Spo0E family protein [Irregularibacter muris]MCR1899549.1 aspartyl-phosphate phosphatase Spo0E family protein [Irregularibacter muris]